MQQKVGVSGLVDPRTGIGVVQKHLYPRLVARGFDITESQSREYEGGLLSRIAALARGLAPARGNFTSYLCVTPPTPLAVGVPLVTVIHDLRWLRTRTGLSRAYRWFDLWRAVRASKSLLCISQRTRDDLVSLFPQAASKTVVSNLGPGNMPTDGFSPASNGKVLLIGAATHKRNELAADALAMANPAWCSGIVGVNVSPHVRSTMDSVFGPSANTWHDRPDDKQLIELYRSCEYFMFLGTEEGFGLPFIEALAAGCQVVAIDHALTRELLDGSATLLPDGDAARIATYLSSAPVVPEDTRRLRATEFSWDSFAASVAALIAQR